MPELPEVETVKNGLAPHMIGSKINRVNQRRENLRFDFPPDFCQRLTGSTITDLSRRAKYLLVSLSNDDVLVMHLGMSGRFTILQAGDNPTAHNTQQAGFVSPTSPVLEKHDHVIFHLSNSVEIRYNDPRRFGFMLLIPKDELENHKFFAKMGVEPLSNSLTTAYLQKQAHNKKSSLKAFLLDQRIIAGLGNIYVCEVLFRTGLSPFDPASILAKTNNQDKVDLLIKTIRLVLNKAIEAGGSTLKDHRQTDGSLGYFQHTFQVYSKEGQKCQAKNCQSLIIREQQNGRSTFFCPTCQAESLKAQDKSIKMVKKPRKK